jgi:hypothetical protein
LNLKWVVDTKMMGRGTTNITFLCTHVYTITEQKYNVEK